MTKSDEVDAFIGLGANLGDRIATLNAAIAAIGALAQTQLVACSSFWQSEPIDAGGDDYINAVVRVATALDARALLGELHAIESRHGRTRPHRNAPRTLDLDLLVFGEETIATRELTVPHPRLAQRAFVLAPLAEIAPGLVVPGVGVVATLLGNVAPQRVARLDR